MEPKVYQAFRNLVYEHSGIFLGDHKQALVSARIGKRMRALGLADPQDYLHVVASDRSGGELGQLLDAISTNVTHFFREARHFDVLAHLVHEAAERRQSSFSIWCAAASSGEEPYSIAMTALESAPPSMRINIIASDIATSVLKKAKFGVYRKQDVEKIDPKLLKKYFQMGASERAKDLYRVKPVLRDLVSFKQINLSTPPFPIQGPLDVVFCRNVMIYFNTELRQKLVQNLFSLLKPGGHLIVGMAESLSSVHHIHKAVEPSVYRKMS
ncbi:MAG: protein-glutamate O-methyltransferase CheR [Candidatus Lambdaproteobacteria bacterium]|nr:protein-glutamate O-methyltransferase CheR [Candidatus Lambdaproteobacteria bacterium]